MIDILRGFVKSIPTLILAFALALAVWISAVTAKDPVEQRLFPRPVTIERQSLDSGLVIANDVPSQSQVTVSAPVSIWSTMLSDRAPIRASIDLSGLGPGTYTLPVDYQPLRKPAKVVSKSPEEVTVVLERLETRQYGVTLLRRGQPAIGFEAGEPALTQNQVTVSGPASNVERVRDVQVTVDLNQASEDITRNLDVQVLDENGAPVEGVTVAPDQVSIKQPIKQRAGYSNKVVRVAYSGQVANGYRLTSVSVSPPSVTVFSSNPSLVTRLPGVIDTVPVNLTGVKDDLEVRVQLNLPDGVEVDGEQTVLVQVSVAAIESSITLSNLPVEVVGLAPELAARISPETVDVIISGPVPLLDNLTANDVQVTLDLTGVTEGTYQNAPRVTLPIEELRVESVLPGSIEVVVEALRNVRRTPSPTPTRTPQVTTTPTPTGQ